MILKIFSFPSIKCMLTFFKCFKYYSYNRVLKLTQYNKKGPTSTISLLCHNIIDIVNLEKALPSIHFCQHWRTLKLYNLQLLLQLSEYCRMMDEAPPRCTATAGGRCLSPGKAPEKQMSDAGKIWIFSIIRARLRKMIRIEIERR